MPVDSKRKMNWTGVSFASVPVQGVKSIGFDRGVVDLQEGADADQGPTVALVVNQNPSFNVVTNMALAIVAVGENTRGVFTATLNDSRNQTAAGGGGFTFTTNALSYIGSDSIQGEYMALATDSFTVKTQWADSVTNPVIGTFL